LGVVREEGLEVRKLFFAIRGFYYKELPVMSYWQYVIYKKQ